ncbi:multicomponent K+:H+ antiporter subunit A [Brevundimonas bullata]|uniref:Multicomponent K+:H+ antiporter subunit A n=1 Tax=Brevundimonas bullata TaxID=13160 RepID=A0A7W7IQ99_9CAUL|nr:monovalent cation/H+ antiporter subunit A [Brevundimonas bullata]MBB4798282.1 multicomponent K+:H+ antiporter subunit A [Brevundimonas bullata]
MPHTFLLLVPFGAPFVASLMAIFLPSRARNAAAGLAWLTSLAGLLCLVALFPAVASGEPVRWSMAWLPTLGVNFTLRLDGLAWLFAVMVQGIGALVVLYARYYMSADDPVPRFFAFLLAFMGAMTGMVMAGDLIQLAVFWELTSLFSFLLIGYWHHNAAARDGARMALTVTAAGGLCLLAGVVVLGRIVGSFDLDVVLASGDLIKNSPWYLTALILILAGALTKSAQFPFHFWLPRAMAAPTPVSAYLHSATMVKAGVFLLIRLWPVLAGTDAWYVIVSTAGMATLLFGAWSAVFQNDLKGLLAYSTISHLGLITLLLGLGSPLAAVAAIFHTVNHATFKASLFMAAGVIDHETGTRDMRKLSGLRRSMPVTAALAIVAAAAMAGVPLLNGFLSKEMFLAEAVAHTGGRHLNLALPVLATVASLLSVLYSVRFIHQTFFGPPPVDLPKTPHEPARWMRFPIEVLVGLCIIVGVLPAITIGPILAVAVRSVLGPDVPYYSLALWHGFSLPLVMSMIALVGGVTAYKLLGPRINASQRPWVVGRFNGARAYDRAMRAFNNGAAWIVQRLGAARQQARLRAIILTCLLAAVLASGMAGLGFDEAGLTIQRPGLGFTLLWIIGGSCAIAAAWQAKYHRLASVVLVGGAGLVSCLTFVWFSAPDLATTQMLVEVVTTVLLLIGLRWLPKRLPGLASPQQEAKARRRRASDLAIAILAGAGVALVAFAVMTRPSASPLARYFLDHAYSEGGGRNVVNVLLVDFRAFDTLGEITVLGIVGLTIWALLRRFRPAADSLGHTEQKRIQDDSDDRREDRKLGDTLSETMLIPRVVMRWLFPFIVLLALHLFLRGHDLPGGGFAAGVTLSIAFILQYMASGARWVEERLEIRPLVWIGGGLLIAALSGVASWLFGYPLLTSWFRYVDLPLIGKTPLASAVVFDAGVALLVVGATVLMLVAIAHQSLRKSRPVPPVVAEEDAV